MAYTLTDAQWEHRIYYQEAAKPRPTPMRPIGQRIIATTDHFVIMVAVTSRWGGKRVALIEKACSSTPVTRIDPRLKSIKRIIRMNSVRNSSTLIGCRMLRRFLFEQQELMWKCERLYPCHFLVKGVTFETANPL